MRAFLILVILLWTAAWAAGQPPREEEAYSMVCRAREAALRLKTDAARAAFARSASDYLVSFPASAHATRVRSWLRELHPPRTAPPLAVDRWVGAPVDPAARHGEVTMLVFFSVTHPQSGWLLPRLVRMRKRMKERGLRVVGVAAVVDDRRRQTPESLAARLRELGLPFPVAVDRQRPDRPSVSLQRYGGASLPWVVLLDRYGRLAWSGDGSFPTRVERKTRELLAQPRLEELAAAVRSGRTPLAELAAIRTKETVTALFALLQAPGLEAEARRALKDLGPAGYDLSRPAAAERRWRREQPRYVFSTTDGRVVPR